tara:strand:- start:50 stop:169 length:120 start_codon:yes stop_codon:yes gene_type:complete
MNMDNPNYIPVNDYVMNEGGALYCMDFKAKTSVVIGEMK